MVPRFFIPTEWLAAIHQSPRWVAVVIVVVCLTMLVLGARAYRWFLIGALAGTGWTIGMMLGRLMHVTPWYVALPAALMLGPLAYPHRLAKWALAGLISFALGTFIGTFVAYGAEIANYWLGFAGGAVVGFGVAALAPRFTKAFFFSVVGTAGSIAALGAIARQESGLFAPGAYLEEPAIFVVIAVILVVASMIAQVYLDPEAAEV